MKNVFDAIPGVVKSPLNPVLTAEDVPYEAGLVFNAGVTKFQGRYLMVFRNDHGATREDFAAHQAGEAPHPRLATNLGLAHSDDGGKWEVAPAPLELPFQARIPHGVTRFYDPRLTVLEGRCYLCFAADSFYGVQGGVAVTDDLRHFELLSLSVPDNRNMVLFPEKIGGRFVRLERPFPVYSRGGNEKFDIWLSSSPDGVHWGQSRLVLGAHQVPFCNCKIGPAAPPVKTPKGWLTTFHAVWKDPERPLRGWHPWCKEYFAGIMLLDLEDPSKVIGLCPRPLIRAEHEYELEGFRGSVIFPGGMLLEDSGEVKLYYGAADTVECLAGAELEILLDACERPA